MKKILGLLMVAALFCSCVDDTSAYMPQEKESVAVDPESDESGEDPALEPGQLRPGVNEITLTVSEPYTVDAATEMKDVQRRFKYYLPPTINPSKPISLIFEFHGSYEYEEGATVPNPIAGVTESYSLNTLATRENCIIVYPAGDVGDASVYWGAEGYARSLPFVDAMLDYFSTKTPRYDDNRVYTTGQSSGAIFSYNLAFVRSDIFAAAMPRSGQMSLAGQTDFPNIVVPIRAFNGVLDDIVSYPAALENITTWAERVGRYYAANSAELDTLTVEGYVVNSKTMRMARRVWRGGSADIELFSLLDEGHGVNLTRMLDYMWEFMSTHVRNMGAPAPLYMNASESRITLSEGQSLTLGISYNSDAAFSHDIPAEWNPAVGDGTLTVTAPADFFTAENREGNFTFTANRGSETKTFTLPYKLTAPKAYFEVGDIYYVNFKPVGVVVWVNNKNIRQAKVVNLTWADEAYGYPDVFYNGNRVQSALGTDFETPSTTDGAGNTAAMMSRNPTIATPNTATSSLWVWAATLAPEGTSDWYLPAIDELAAMYPNLAKINAALATVAGRPIASSNYYSSTVKLSANPGQKEFYFINFANGSTSFTSPAATNPEYLGYVVGRAFKVVTK